MNTRSLRRGMLVVALAVAGFALAPAAFARSHVSIGVGFYGPGYSIGLNDCVHCGYYRRAYYPTYYGRTYYDPGYYAPAPVYYDPYPAYGTVYYGGYYGGGYYHRHWRGRDDHRRHGDHDHHHH